MSSVSGLNAAHRIRARDLAVQAALHGLRRAPEIHYTQGPQRWEGIAHHLKAHRGEVPTHADCSSFWTWCLWNGLDHYGVRDTVNGCGWAAGFTGTMLEHGKRVVHLGNVLRGDLVIYGDHPQGEHVAGVVGTRNGVPMVVSNGSEAGPFYLPYNYRRDILQIRRYI